MDDRFTKKLHPKVQYQLGKVSPEKQIKFKNLYLLKKRSLVLAYICLAFFPGTHYAFLGRWQMQILFWLTLGGFLVWWITDMIRLNSIVNQVNYTSQQKILREINSVNVFKTAKPLRVPVLTNAKVA